LKNKEGYIYVYLYFCRDIEGVVCSEAQSAPNAPSSSKDDNIEQ